MDEMKEMRIFLLPVDGLVPYENNPRNNDGAVDAVANSIREFGFKVPIIIDKNNVIVAGHTRLKAAKKLGMTEVPCIIADDLTEDQIRAFRLADNKVGEIATWDLDKLSIELSEIELDMSGFGFDIDEEEELEIQEVDPVEPPVDPKSKKGDIWILGRHRLMCGDSTDITDVQHLMGGCQADLFLTDPPYNVDYEGKTKDRLKIDNDSMEDSEFRSFLRSAFYNANECMKEGAVFYIWHSDSEGYNFRGACHDVGWIVREVLIWEKNRLVFGRQDYQWKHEPCLYGWKEGASHLWASDRKQTTIINFDRPTQSRIHPTMKPVCLFDYLIQNNTKGGDIVLDLFNGSGTTIIACEQNKRTAFCMEIDPHYVDAAIQRWENLTGEKAVLLEEEENV